MTVTAQQVYNIAISLIDSVDETGAYAPDNPEEYQKKSLDFLTLLQTELMSNDQTPIVLSNMTDNLIISDKLALSVLPYGLAAHLLVQEDPNSASFFNSRYDELKRIRSTQIENIVDQYDVLNGMC